MIIENTLFSGKGGESNGNGKIDKSAAANGNEGALTICRGYRIGMTAVSVRCECIGFLSGFVVHSTGRMRVNLAIFSRMNQLRSGFDEARVR